MPSKASSRTLAGRGRFKGRKFLLQSFLDQGTAAANKIPPCRPGSCTTGEVTTKIDLHTQNCTAEFKFDDQSAGVSLGTSISNPLAIARETVVALV